MPRRRQEDGNRLPAEVQAYVDSLSPDDVLLPRLLAAGRAELLKEPPPRSRRRPPREDVVTFRVRVDLDGATPPIWRRLELASDLTLDVLHRVLQVAMGWTDNHLHGFSAGGGRFDRDAELYLTDFDISEGEEGVPEREVRLDEVLQDVGDRLFYMYDFGDDWAHTVRLEAVEPRAPEAPPAVVTAGRRACPPEDVGGVHRYSDIVAALEGRPSDLDEDLDEWRTWVGPDFDPAALPLDSVNKRLRYAVLGYAGAGRGRLPEVVDGMLRRVGEDARPLLEELVARAELGAGPLVGVDDAERMVRPYAWLLRRIGPDGVRLTSAGYLPPAVVEDVVRELDLGREWIGAGNREHHTWPVLEFRESAQQLGLLRKRSGWLLPTVRGRAVTDDPVAMWQHIAERLPLGRTECERQAGTVLLLLTAGGDDIGWQLGDALAAVLGSLGWRAQSTGFLSPSLATEQARPTWEVLRRMGAVAPRWPMAGTTTIGTPGGRLLARAALQAGG
jgi:hypothetical protein